MTPRRRKADWLAFIAWALVVAAFAAGVYRVEDTRKDADRAIRAESARSDAAIRASATERARQIQASRREVLIRSCREQNRRHDSTVRQLDRLIKGFPPGSPRRRRAERGRAGTVALIEALAPRRQCVRRAERLIRPIK